MYTVHSVINLQNKIVFDVIINFLKYCYIGNYVYGTSTGVICILRWKEGSIFTAPSGAYFGRMPYFIDIYAVQLQMRNCEATLMINTHKMTNHQFIARSTVIAQFQAPCDNYPVCYIPKMHSGTQYPSLPFWSWQIPFIPKQNTAKRWRHPVCLHQRVNLDWPTSKWS
jgi:hypothetical protein